VSAAPLRAHGVTSAHVTAFSFAFDLTRYRRRLTLTRAETTGLIALGAEGLRRSRARGAVGNDASWATLAGLVGPIDDALATLHHNDSPLHRLAASDAAALVLGQCLRVERSWWGWTAADWRELLGVDATAFRAAVTWPASTTVRSFVLALAYLLGGFSEFHLIGMFDRRNLAGLVFGDDAVDNTLAEVASLLGSWGYRGHDDSGPPLPGAFSQFLLLNRSPLMADLTTQAFTPRCV
jgi:hypothetical protein